MVKVEEDFDEIFNLEEDVDAQEELQNNTGEKLPDESIPAQKRNTSEGAGALPAVKVIPPEIIYALKKLERLEDDINTVMSNCNDIERGIQPTLKQGTHIRENFENEIAKRGERALLYYQADIISKFSSTFSTVDGYIKNIKFAMGRLQETVTDIKERIEDK
jgi:hypothetical protein